MGSEPDKKGQLNRGALTSELAKVILKQHHQHLHSSTSQILPARENFIEIKILIKPVRDRTKKPAFQELLGDALEAGLYTAL